MMLRVFSRFLLVILVRNCLMLVLLLVLLSSLLLPLAVVSVLFQGRTGPPQNRLYSVAALSEKNIWAVGEDSILEGSQPLIEHWDGTRWNVVSSHTLPEAGPSETCGRLEAVSALAANNIWSVGIVGCTYLTYPLIEHWDGRTWRIIPSPKNFTGGSLNSIVALSEKNIWAVGGSTGSTGEGPLIEQWNGTRWRIIPSPESGGNQGPINTLNGIVAISQDNMWAVGTSGEGPLIEQWNGTRWHILSPAHPLISSSSVLSSAKLYATAALAANNIWTVGSTGTLDEKEALIEHWNGKEWRIISNGPPLSHIFGNVYGIAVISVESIWAVGDTRRNTGAVLSEHWNGTKWSLISVPDPDTSSPYDPPGSYELRGIAALADDNIWAVGSSDSIGKYSDARTYGMTSKTLIEHWDGRNWRIISSPNPGAPPSIPSFQLY